MIRHIVLLEHQVVPSCRTDDGQKVLTEFRVHHLDMSSLTVSMVSHSCTVRFAQLPYFLSL